MYEIYINLLILHENFGQLNFIAKHLIYTDKFIFKNIITLNDELN